MTTPTVYLCSDCGTPVTEAQVEKIFFVSKYPEPRIYAYCDTHTTKESN